MGTPGAVRAVEQSRLAEGGRSLMTHVVGLGLKVHHLLVTIGRRASVDLLEAGVLQRLRVHYAV